MRFVCLLCFAKHLKHVLAPTEKEASLTTKERFNQEFVVRYLLDIYNDIAWAAVNLLCNYGYLSDPVANWLTAAFLLLDAMALLTSLYLAYQDYAFKKAQYNQERILIADDNSIAATVLDEQLKQLEIDWGTKKARTLFFASAALILASGFSISLLLTSPVAITACFLSCTVGVAMYLSADKYGDYAKASLSVKDEADNTGLAKVDAAFSALLFSLAKIRLCLGDGNGICSLLAFCLIVRCGVHCI